MAIKKRNLDADKLAEFVDDMQDAFGPLFQGELDNHLGYDAYSKEPNKHDNRRSSKKIVAYVPFFSRYFRV